MKFKKTIFLIIAAALVILALFFFNRNGWFKDTESFEYENAEIPFDMPEITSPKFPDNNCNIKNYGAVGDGAFVNTQPIKNAIEDCSSKGGGKVIFPKGKWLTGPIHLKSNINLYLEENSEIVFTTNLNDYLPVVFTKFQGIEYYNFSPLIYGKDLENIALTGKGKISGSGDFWEEWASDDNSEIQREKLFKMSEANAPVEERVWGTKDSGLRPSFIQFINCKNIFVEGLTIENGPMWTIHPIYSENLIVRRVNIKTHSMNTDGVAVDSSKNVIIENSVFSTGDDAIAIKSGAEEEGRRINRPSENIVVRNSKFENGHGAIAIGSEMSGGVRNVFISNCSFNGTNSGLRIKSSETRGGFVENIWMKDVQMNKIRDNAIVFNLKYKTAFSSDILMEPELKNITIENIEGKFLTKAIEIIGLPNGKMENIYFKNLELESQNGSDLKYAKNLKIENLSLKVSSPKSALKIENGQNIEIDNFRCENTGDLCLNIEGEETEGINLINSGIAKDRVFVEEEIEKQVKMN